MSSNKYLRVSLSSTYVVFVENALDPNTGYMYKVTLPGLYVNSETGAKNYFLEKVDRTARVIACLPFEVCSEGIEALELERRKPYS